MQRAVEEKDMVAEIEELVLLEGQLVSPGVLVTEEDASLGLHLGSFDHGREQLDLFTDLTDLAVNAVVAAAVVGQDSSVELLRADAWLSPEKVQNSGDTAGQKLVGEQPHDTRAHQ